MLPTYVVAPSPTAPWITLLKYFLRKAGSELLVVKAYGERGSLGMTKNELERTGRGRPREPLRGEGGVVGPRDPASDEISEAEAV
jgi:hypothetical protein